MLITKIQLAAMERVRIPEGERRDFYLYVDEFQNFATEAFASILSEARKYRLDLIIAHQYVGQLITDTTTKVRDAVFGNVGTMIAFRVGASDAEFLEKEFEPEFNIQDLVNLPNYNIYLKLMVNGVTSRPFSALTIPPLASTSLMAKAERIIEASRKHYASDVKKVEEGIKQWSSSIPEATGFEGVAPPRVGVEKFETPCWLCKKTAYTTFKPDGRRPVYCSSCLQKIEAGDLRPIRPLPSYIREREELGGGLGELGIEFSPEPKSLPRREPRIEGAPQRPRARFHREIPASSTPPTPSSSRGRAIPNIKEGEFVAKKAEPRRTLFLNELKNRIKKDTHKESRLAELRKVLAESLEEKDEAKSSAEADDRPTHSSRDSNESRENKKENKEKSTNRRTKVIKPGESIKF